MLSDGVQAWGWMQEAEQQQLCPPVQEWSNAFLKPCVGVVGTRSVDTVSVLASEYKEGSWGSMR